MTEAMGRAAEHPAAVEGTPPEEVIRALTLENCRLLALIHRHRPDSVTELCRLAGRTQSNVSRSLATLERAGIVFMSGSRPKRPTLAVRRIAIDLADLRSD